ncbi:MAG: PspC domain-containing protein [Butyricicoccus sp.]|nr:PspC domain-containing protein [Butyricicoccus sp.]MBQ8585860.1 PspC domain-containing protein [Butyricicoccus sp.]
MNGKKLTRSISDCKICGVCGGIGEFIGLDSTIIRLLFALFGLSGTGIVAYIICAIIMPQSDTYNQ